MRNTSLGVANAMILNKELKDISSKVPPQVVQKLKLIPLWVGHPTDRQLGVYHPSRDWLIENNMNPAFAGSACFPFGAAFPNAVRDCPSIVLPEVSHCYQNRFFRLENSKFLMVNIF